MPPTQPSERAPGAALDSARRHSLVALSVVLLSWCVPVGAQVVYPGRVAERVVSVTDTTQSYAVYLPSAYDGARRWPVIFLMDPRGRALVPLRLFRAAAERDGYILLSSYNTLSDGPSEPNAKAMNAMLGDARATFSLDPQRYYLAGFSGTARVAWDMAVQLKGAVAGIFGASAGTASPPPWLGGGGKPPAVAFYGTAGSVDFNHDEMVSFRGKLRAWGLPVRLRFFDGPHAWPPEDLCSEALDWFTLQAMRRHRIATRPAFVDSLFQRDSARADSLQANGRALDAWEGYQEMLADYAGVHGLDGVRGRSAVLDRSSRLPDQRAERDRLLQQFAGYADSLYAYLRILQEGGHPATADDIARRLRIAELQATARADDPRGLEARRSLELAFVQLAFYVPRAELGRNRPDYALPLLHVAGLIKPHHPTVLLNTARAFVEEGRRDDALGILTQAVRGGVRRARIRDDTTFSPLRGDPRFEALLRGGG